MRKRAIPEKLPGPEIRKIKFVNGVAYDEKTGKRAHVIIDTIEDLRSSREAEVDAKTTREKD